MSTVTAASSTLDQLYGRNSLADLYAARKTAASGESVTPQAAATDTVELSAQTPKQIAMDLFRDATSVASKISGGGELTAEEIARMQSDPSFASTTALLAFNSATGNGLLDMLDGGSSSSGTSTIADLVAQYTGQWPAEVETSTSDEIADLVKRLTQRLSGGTDAEDADDLEALRRQLVDQFRDGDYSGVTSFLSAISALE